MELRCALCNTDVINRPMGGWRHIQKSAIDCLYQMNRIGLHV